MSKNSDRLISIEFNPKYNNLGVWWYNKRFNFAYWLLGAKSMRVKHK